MDGQNKIETRNLAIVIIIYLVIILLPLILTGCALNGIEKQGVKPTRMIIIRPGQKIPW